LFCGKGPLAIAAMNAELSPFKNEEHNSEGESTLDRELTPSMSNSLGFGLGDPDLFPSVRVMLHYPVPCVSFTLIEFVWRL